MTEKMISQKGLDSSLVNQILPPPYIVSPNCPPAKQWGKDTVDFDLSTLQILLHKKNCNSDFSQNLCMGTE